MIDKPTSVATIDRGDLSMDLFMVKLRSMGRPRTGHDRNLRVMLTTEELNMLHALADDSGLTASDVIRLQLREAYRTKFGTRKPKPRT